MTIDIESLGFTKAELQKRLIDQLCERVLSRVSCDEDGEEVHNDSEFKRALDKAIKARIDETINAIAEKHVLPNVSTYIENLSLQETTKWGAAKGAPVSFTEYLVKRAEDYMLEKVDYEGKCKNESHNSSFWNGTQTRLTHLVHKHLHYSIESAMKNALSIANSAIAQGIQETVKIKLAEISKHLAVGIKTTK
jgi:hypothetical protein